MTATDYFLQDALIDGTAHPRVWVRIEGGRFTAVVPDTTDPPAGALPVVGLTVPGFANTHSHAFHRALRGRTQAGRGSFWTWREQMYAAAARLGPDGYYDLARAVFAEMVAAGFTTVGEFHYVHHRPDGSPYPDPNAVGRALIAAALETGLRITLLDTCYLAAGFGVAPESAQLRFADRDATAWAARVSALADGGAETSRSLVGAAIHSVRAVPSDQFGPVLDWVRERQRPVHLHLSEQRAENQACLDRHGVTPTRLLADHGVLGPLTTVVHATHLTDADIALLAESGTTVAFCPTTERDLGDGIGPGRRLAEAGVPLTLGTDSHAVIDPFEEMRALELNERLASQTRGHWTAAELIRAGTGHHCLGWSDAGRIEVGCRADLVTLDTGSPRTAGTGADAATAVFAASAADVTRVIIDGQIRYDSLQARGLGDAIDLAMTRFWT